MGSLAKEDSEVCKNIIVFIRLECKKNLCYIAICKCFGILLADARWI